MESKKVNEVVAFLPIRAGSKSIQNKNVKKLGEFPLFIHILLSAITCRLIEKIYIATDIYGIHEIIDKELGNIPIKLKQKIKVIGRSEKSCMDLATTEVAMIEFAHKYKFENIILLQATSPMTTTRDLVRGIECYNTKKYDSVLSVVRNKKFLWKYKEEQMEYVEAINYDFFSRPMRQNLNLEFCENGAFYITSREKLLQTKCRISGNIGVSVMDDITEIEVDEINDWIMLKALYNVGYCRKRKIKLLALDWDGVMSDGRVFVSGKNVTQKIFSMIDGEGISIIKEYGVKVLVITAEQTDIDGIRCKKLGIKDFKSGISDKLKVLSEYCLSYNIDLDNVAYIGDDINDLEVIKNVGFSFAPQNAQTIVKKVVNICLSNLGGNGAVREAINYLIQNGMVN